MKNNQINNKLKELANAPLSSWVQESDERLKNPNTPSYSQLVAIRILRTLRAKNLTQKDLATLLGVTPQAVNKWVKGNENFTFDSVERIEKALNIKLMHIYSSQETAKADTSIIGVTYPAQISRATTRSMDNPIMSKAETNESKVIKLKPYYLTEATVPKLNYCNS